MTRNSVVPGPAIPATIRGLCRSPFAFCMEAARQGDGLVRINAGLASAYLVSDPKLVRRVLVDNAGAYAKGSMMNGIRVALGNGLFTADGPAWRRQRRLMQPAFQADRLSEVSHVVSEVLAESGRRWDAHADRHEPIDILAETIRVNTEVVLRALIGTDYRSAAPEELTRLIDSVFAGMSRRMWTFFLPAWLPTPGRTAYRRAVADLDSRIHTIIAQRRAIDGAERDDLLGRLLAARDDDGQPMSDTQLRDEIFTMFLAGNESTAASTTWTLYLLARHPDAMTRIRAELATELDGRAPTFAELPRLPYLHQVISEGFRLYPAFPMYFRTAVAADRLGEYDIPAGAYIIVSPWATHRDPRHWDAPDTFDPERFAPARFDARSRLAYYPFGVGQRRCIGEPMSLKIAATTLAALVARYEIALPDAGGAEGRYAMSYQPRGGLKVLLHKLTNA